MLEEKDAGSTVVIQSGETLTISLQGNPSTGYMWEVTHVDEGILAQTGKAEFIPDSEDRRGAGGRVMIRFKAVHTGETTLMLIYHRSFEKNRPPLKTFEVTVSVEEEEK